VTGATHYRYQEIPELSPCTSGQVRHSPISSWLSPGQTQRPIGESLGNSTATADNQELGPTCCSLLRQRLRIGPGARLTSVTAVQATNATSPKESE